MEPFTRYIEFGVLGMTIFVLMVVCRSMWVHLRDLNTEYRNDIKEFSTRHDELVEKLDQRQERRDQAQTARDEKITNVLSELSMQIRALK